MIENKCSLRFIDFIQERTESIGVELSICHEANSHQACFEFLIPAVSQERSVDTQGNSELCDLFLPHFGNRHACGNGAQFLHKQLPRQLLCSMPRCDMTDFVCDNRGEFIIV